MDLEKISENIVGFDWDDGNLYKNWLKHKIKDSEAEEIFFNEPLLIYKDVKHSQRESRYYCLGRTSENKKLFVGFTIRNNKIRIISARIMSRNEKRIYEK